MMSGIPFDRPALHTHKHSWYGSTSVVRDQFSSDLVKLIIQDLPIDEDESVPNPATTCPPPPLATNPTVQRYSQRTKTYHNSGGTGFTPSHS